MSDTQVPPGPQNNEQNHDAADPGAHPDKPSQAEGEDFDASQLGGDTAADGEASE
jgi:hypothetical protein